MTPTQTHDQPTELAAQPRRQQLLGSYRAFRGADETVDRLLERGFPPQRCAIVGQALRRDGRMDSRQRRRRIARQAAFSGALVGGAVATASQLVVGASTTAQVMVTVLAGILLGTVVSVVDRLVGVLLRGGHEFRTIQVVQAQRYEVYVDADLIGYARRLSALPPIRWIGQHRPVRP